MPGSGARIDELADLAAERIAVSVDHIGRRAEARPAEDVGLIGVNRLQPTMPPPTSVPPL